MSRTKLSSVIQPVNNVASRKLLQVQQTSQVSSKLEKPLFRLQNPPICSFSTSQNASFQRMIGNQLLVQRAGLHSGRILYEGDCQHLACQSKWACESDTNGTVCPDGTRNSFAKTNKKYNPLFTCDSKCENNLACSDADNWMAIPRSRFARGKCNQDLVICANKRFTHAHVRDRSHINAWEVSPKIQNDLGVSGTFMGSVYGSETDPQFLTDTHCRPVASTKVQRSPNRIKNLSLPKTTLQKCACDKTNQSGEVCDECLQKQVNVQLKQEHTLSAQRQKKLNSGRALDYTPAGVIQRIGPAAAAGTGAAAGVLIGALSFAAALSYAKNLSNRYPGWLSVLPNCPCTVNEIHKNQAEWEADKNPLLEYFHPGADKSFRSKSAFSSVPGSSHGQQCTYDAKGKLITEGPGAGTPDVWSPNTHQSKHTLYDAGTWQVLGWRIYNQYWKPNTGNNCPSSRGKNTFMRRISEFFP